jgi:hypothetical protein
MKKNMSQVIYHRDTCRGCGSKILELIFSLNPSPIGDAYVPIDKIQLDHYLDEGCKCKACSIKRRQAISNILNGIELKDKIYHIESKNELINKRVLKVSKINALLNKTRQKMLVKDLNMKSVVQKSGKRMDIKI